MSFLREDHLVSLLTDCFCFAGSMVNQDSVKAFPSEVEQVSNSLVPVLEMEARVG